MKHFYQITILGNHEDPMGNPVPYYRMTQRSKWKDKGAQRYLAWKKYVAQIFKYNLGSKFNEIFQGNVRTTCSCTVYFKNKKHGDSENIMKGIRDAVYKNDKYVAGCVDFDYDDKNPRVEVWGWVENWEDI